MLGLNWESAHQLLICSSDEADYCSVRVFASSRRPVISGASARGVPSATRDDDDDDGSRKEGVIAIFLDNGI
jgi:hypothetical protein